MKTRNKYILTQNKSVRFRRWSRAKYAVFVSLSICVTIGQLTVSVSESSLKKQQTAENETGLSNLLKENSEDDRDLQLQNDFQISENLTVSSVPGGNDDCILISAYKIKHSTVDRG